MLAFLYNNTTFLFVLIVILTLIAMYYHFKSLPAKVVKKEDKKEAKPEPAKKEEVVEQKEEKKVETKEEKEAIQEEAGRGKNSKVSHIYKRQKSEQTSTGEVEKVSEGDYDAEFVNVSKNVSRFKGLVAKEEEIQQLVNEAETDQFGFAADVQEDCEFCEVKTKHFDHSRRLSKYIKEDNFDGMFASHISDYYMRMDNIDKHVGVSGESLNKLYEKASKTLDNSEKRLTGGNVEKSIIKSEFENMEEVITDEDLKSIADLRTIVITDSIMNRKKKK